MVFGRKHVAPEPDPTNLRFWRQLAAAESVDADDRARTGHLFQRFFHLVRIVGQRIDLFAREQVAERVAPRIGRPLAADPARP